jgi:hypothetical protein
MMTLRGPIQRFHQKGQNMIRYTLRTSWPVLFLAAALLNTWALGCGGDDDKPQLIQREGRVASINKETCAVEMWYYSPKQRQEIKIPGRLDPNVEILINGAVASVDDVKIDDRVKVLGRSEGSGMDQHFVAVKVEVIRPVSETIPAASAPTAPAER